MKPGWGLLCTSCRISDNRSRVRRTQNMVAVGGRVGVVAALSRFSVLVATLGCWLGRSLMLAGLIFASFRRVGQ